MSTSTVTQATEAFRAALEEAWSAHRQREHEITQVWAPVIADVTLFLEAIAATVSELTGESAKVTEAKSTYHDSTRSLVMHQCVLHPRGDFHVRLHLEPDCVEYHRERLRRHEASSLLERIARDAVLHFGPKPITGAP